jgi:hypothetical protein
MREIAQRFIKPKWIAVFPGAYAAH